MEEIKKYDEPVNYKQLPDDIKNKLKEEMFLIFCELKKGNPAIDVKPKDIADEVLKKYNIVISPQTLKAIWRINKWDKKLMVSIGSGLIDGVKQSIIDENTNTIRLNNFEKELFDNVKVFMGKRFGELQHLADKLYSELNKHDVLSKNFWKGLNNYLAIHDKQIKMLEVIGVDKIMSEMINKDSGNADMNKIIELYELAEQNAKIIKEMIEREEGKLINVEVLNDEEKK